MALLPYIGSVINLGNSFSQATRPRNVGQMSDLIQEYREVAGRPTVEGWESFYDQKIGSDKIDVAADKIWEYVQRIRENLNSLNRDDVKNWTKDLIIDKTFSGLRAFNLTSLRWCQKLVSFVCLHQMKNLRALMDMWMENQYQSNPTLTRKLFNQVRNQSPTVLFSTRILNVVW